MVLSSYATKESIKRYHLLFWQKNKAVIRAFSSKGSSPVPNNTGQTCEISPAFQKKLDQQLLDEANLSSLPEIKKFVSIIIDKMKIKEGLVVSFLEKLLGNYFSVVFGPTGTGKTQLVRQACSQPRQYQ